MASQNKSMHETILRAHPLTERRLEKPSIYCFSKLSALSGIKSSLSVLALHAQATFEQDVFLKCQVQ